jgi:hypothetical protein
MRVDRSDLGGPPPLVETALEVTFSIPGSEERGMRVWYGYDRNGGHHGLDDR